MHRGQPTGETAIGTFAELVEDLTEAVTGDDSPLAAALTQELGATLDKDAFVAPTGFAQVELKVPSPPVMLLPSQANQIDPDSQFQTMRRQSKLFPPLCLQVSPPKDDDSGLPSSILLIIVTGLVTAACMTCFGIGYFKYLKVSGEQKCAAVVYDKTCDSFEKRTFLN